MKKLPYDYLYLGFALAFFADLSFLDWKFYAILVPFTILETLRNFKR
jgi:hypothetical protein